MLPLPRRSKPSVNLTKVRNFSRHRRPNYSRHPFEPSVDGCLMPSIHSAELGKEVFIRLVLVGGLLMICGCSIGIRKIVCHFPILLVRIFF